MANTLNDLIPTLYEAANVVSRELVGMIPAVRHDASAERAALGQDVVVPIAAVAAADDVTPGVNTPNDGDAVISNTKIVINKSRYVPVRWNGEQQLGVSQSYDNIIRDQFTEAMRKLVNEVELDLTNAAAKGASRGYKGNQPFNSDMTEIATARSILEELGAPQTDLQFVLNSTSAFNFRKAGNLYKVNEAGSSDMLREGFTERLMGFAMRNSGQIKALTTGGDNTYVTDGAPLKGDTSFAIKTGALAVPAGSPFKITGNTVDGKATHYILAEGISTSGTVAKINFPGLYGTGLANAKALTFETSALNNYAFDRNALVLVTRAPAVPNGGDSADDAVLVTDPLSGITFEVRLYRQYRQVRYEVSLAWGAAAVNSQHIVTLFS